MRKAAILFLLLSTGCVPEKDEAKAPEATATASTAAPVATATATAPAQARKTEERTASFEFDYSYPAEAAAIPALAAELEADLAKQRRELAAAAREGRVAAQENGFPFNPYSYSAGWSVVTDLPGWLSLSAGASTYTGGAHPNHWSQALLWDKAAGKSRVATDLFVSKAALAAAIRGKATPDDIRVLAISHLIIGPMLQVITSAWMDWRDDDDDEIFDEKNWEGWDMARSVLLGPAAGLPLIREIVDDFSGDSGPLAAFGKALADSAAIVKGPTDSEPEMVEWYGKRIAGVLKGLSAFPAVLAGIGDQLFRVSDNLIETDDEIRAKIQTLQRKLEREKDREEQDALRERILGLQSKLK